MDYTILSDELTNDPLVRGYSAMSDSAAADDINLIYRPSANVIAEMVKYLINKKHRTNQGSDDTYTSIIGRLKHVARSSAGDDPKARPDAWTMTMDNSRTERLCEAIRLLAIGDDNKEEIVILLPEICGK